MKGNFVPGIVVTFAVAAIAGMAVTDITFKGISNLASDTSQNTDAQWVESTLSGPIIEKCKNSGKNDPTPLETNFTHKFDGLDNISVEIDGSRFRTFVILKYRGSDKRALLEDKSVGGPSCENFILNGTNPDGSKISITDEIELEDTELKLRVFETSHTSGGYKNITLQVRQD